MAKDTNQETDDELDNKVVEGVEGAELPEKEEALKDVRGAIRAAIKEQENAETDKEKDPEEKTPQKKDKPDRKVASKQEASDRDDKQLQSKKEETKDIEAPGFWKNKGKTLWEKLSPEDRQLIAAREKEVSDGFAANSPKLKAFEEMERVIAPRAQTIQRFGVSPAQVFDRTLQWFEAISHPDVNRQISSFKELAKSFNVDLNRLVPRQNNTSETENQDPHQQTENNEPPAWFQQYQAQTQNEVGQIKHTLTTQQQAAAEAVVSNWAKDKPHFQSVRGLMAQLSTPRYDNNGQSIADAVVPLKNGQIDLDGAYEAAIKLHPEIAAQVQQEAAQKAKAEFELKANKEAKEKAERLARARKAGVGLKPATSSMASSSPGQKLNGKKGTVSIRDSIVSAVEEVRENN